LDARSQQRATWRAEAACVLPELAPEALRLVEFEGVSQVEAAERLGLSVSGMKSRVQRARLHLRTALDECCQIALDRRGGVISYEARTEQCGTCQGPSETPGSEPSPPATPAPNRPH
jgi:RNA polymerase sigma-70 factor (ECF subfamily)